MNDNNTAVSAVKLLIRLRCHSDSESYLIYCKYDSA